MRCNHKGCPRQVEPGHRSCRRCLDRTAARNRRLRRRRREGTDQCECGNPKSIAAECCDRCAYLDGASGYSGVQADVIAALREGEACTIDELIAATGRCYRSIIRAVSALRSGGRVARHASDELAESGGYLYMLVDRQEVAA